MKTEKGAGEGRLFVLMLIRLWQNALAECRLHSPCVLYILKSLLLYCFVETARDVVHERRRVTSRSYVDSSLSSASRLRDPILCLDPAGSIPRADR